MPRMLELDGRSLTVADVVDVADGRAVPRLGAAARARMEATRRVVDDLVASGRPAYGVTTGFGRLADVAIPPDRLAELQRNLVRSHAAGVGAPLPRREARAMMLLRANVLATGHGGARPLLADRLCELLARDLVPRVPEQGSVGASGDLAPLAHLACTLIGDGELWHDGAWRPAAEALAAHGLAALDLAPKEGLTLINGTQAHTAVTALALHEARRLWRAAHVAAAATLDGVLGTPDAWQARIHDARGQVGQRDSAALLRALAEGSAIRESHRVGDPRVQDAYALRCVPQVHGPALDALRFAEGLVARECNAATDNPLVFEDGTLVSGGNFHGQAVGLAADVAAIACTTLATMSERRIDRLLRPEESAGLPPFLAPDAGAHSGFMIAHVTAAALASECKGLAHPATVDTIPTSGGREDVVPMAMGAALKLRRVVHAVRHVLAIECLCAAQALDARAPLRPSPLVAEAHARIRRLVPRLDADRMLSAEITALADALAGGLLDDLGPDVP